MHHSLFILAHGTELAVKSNVPAKYSAEDFAAVSSTSGFLPRLQLIGSNSELAQTGKMGQGRYAVIHSKDSFEDLGDSVDCVIFSWRPKALSVSEETVISNFKPESDEFKRIREKSAEKDSGCMFCPEFLCWVPGAGFVTFFMGSKTARREAGKMQPLVGHSATLKAQLISTAKYRWHGPVILPCSTPIADLPSQEELDQTVDKFVNPPESQVETVEASGSARER